MNWGDWAKIQQQQQQATQPAAAQKPQGNYSPVSTVGQPPAPATGPANPYGPPVADTPTPRTYTPPSTGVDANRSQFLQKKATDQYERPAATYNDYVSSGLEDALGKVINTPGGKELYFQYQSADPAKKKAFGDRLRDLVYASASQQGVAPADEWISKKTGKSAAEGKDQYFNDAMTRYSAKQEQGAKDGAYRDAMVNKYLKGRYDPQGHQKLSQAMDDYRAGKAQSIQPPSQGMPYGYEPSLPPGTTAADIVQRYNARNAAPTSAAPAARPTFTKRPWQARQ
jgi:hypothetical protein